MSWIGKSIKTEGRLAIARNWGWKAGSSSRLGDSFQRWWKWSLIDYLVMVVQLYEYANHWIGGYYVSELYGIRTTSQLSCFWKVLAILKMKVLVAQLCPTVSDPVDCSPPGSSVHGILQARILEWVAIPFSRGSSWPRDWTQVSCIAGTCFSIWVTILSTSESINLTHTYAQMV